MIDIASLWDTHAPQLEQLTALLRATFPDDRVAITRELAATVASALPEKAQESVFGELIGSLVGIEFPPIEPEFIVGYYVGEATHTRFAGPGSDEIVHRFVGRVPMVRVRLPETQQDISTAIGIVFAGDHRLYTRPIFVEHYKDFLGWEPTRVELLTPARYLGARFGAIATYALFDEKGYRGFALEAGMATGEPMVVYASRDGSEIVRRAGYSPTPFSTSSQFYAGYASFDRYGEPQMLNVDVMPARDQKRVIEVDVAYKPNDGGDRVWPARLTAEAAMRVAAIGERLGKPLPGVGPLGGILAAFGRELEWEVSP